MPLPIQLVPKELQPKKENEKKRESYIEKKSWEYAEKIGGFYQRKFFSPGHAAVPDRIFIEHRDGEIVRLFFIEFKATGKTATEAQKEEHEEMRACGITVYVCDNVEYAKCILAGLA